MAQWGFLPTTLCCGVIRTHVSQTGTFEGLSTSVPWLNHLSNRAGLLLQKKKAHEKTFSNNLIFQETNYKSFLLNLSIMQIQNSGAKLFKLQQSFGKTTFSQATQGSKDIFATMANVNSLKLIGWSFCCYFRISFVSLLFFSWLKKFT